LQLRADDRPPCQGREKIGRHPFLWDNYPVNDGQRMSRHLHIRGFTGRSPEIWRHIAAHGINPPRSRC
jgi:hypothetical protein